MVDRAIRPYPHAKPDGAVFIKRKKSSTDTKRPTMRLENSAIIYAYEFVVGVYKSRGINPTRGAGRFLFLICIGG